MCTSLVGLAVATAVLWCGADLAAGQDSVSLRVDTVAHYSVDVDGAAVEVVFEYVFRNISDDAIFPGFFESVPATAVEVVAESGGAELLAAPGLPEAGFTQWLVAFPSGLEPGDTIDLSLRWRLLSGDGATVSPGTVMFDAYVGGTQGVVAPVLEIDVPSGFSPLDEGDAVTVETFDEGDTITVVGGAAYDPVLVLLENAGQLSRRQADADVDITIASVAGGSEWATMVDEAISDAVPVLTTWFGAVSGPVEIRERLRVDSHRDLADQTGFLAVASAEGPAMVVHQLTHAWLSDLDVAEDWFVEGLARAAAVEISGSPGDNTPGPAEVMLPIAEQLRTSGIRSVIDALRADSISYPGAIDETTEAQVLAPTWRTLLDLFEQVGGVEADALFRSHVVDQEHIGEMDQRLAARRDYGALETRAGDWALPPLLRVPMAEWDFDLFFLRQGDVSDALSTRDGLRAWADDVELDLGPFAQDAFAAAGEDMSETTGILERQTEALEAIAEARRLVEGDRGLLARIGLIGRDPDGDLAAVFQLWERGDFQLATTDSLRLTDQIEGAVGRGTIRLVGPAIGLLALWNLGRWLLKRRKTQTA